MKVLMFSDLHIKQYSGVSFLNRICDNGLTNNLNNIIEACKFVAGQIEQEKPDCVVNLGDSFHVPEFIRVSEICAADQCFGIISKACQNVGSVFYSLMGNHSIFSDKLSFAPILEKYSNVIYGSDFRLTMNNIGLVSYTEKDNLRESIESLVKLGAKIICVHADFAGAKYDSGKVVKDGLEYDGDVQIFSGHIHAYQTIKNVYYIGSLIRNFFLRDLNFGGITIWEDNKDIRRIKGDTYYQNIKIDMNDIDIYLGLKVIGKIETNEQLDRSKIPYNFFTKPVVGTKIKSKFDGIEVNVDKMDMAQIIIDYLKENNIEVIDTFGKIFKNDSI
jgi:predicted phosphodiesterase